MLAIKPLQPPTSTCPNCQGYNQGFPHFEFYGWQVMGEGECKHCGIAYYHTWPIGHGAQFPVALAANGKTSYSPIGDVWFAKPLLKTIRSGLKYPVRVERAVNRQTSEGLLLNCLDPCFGHIIWKLFNLVDYRDQASRGDIIVLIPKQCSWMVPQYVSEVWEVEVPLNKLHYRLDGLHHFIQTVPIKSLRLLPLKTHRHHGDIPMADFFRHPPFNLEEFLTKPLRVTFIWREDRFWLRSKLEELVHRATVKFGWNFLKRWFCYRQLNSMENVAAQVRAAIPEVKFQVTGLGTRGRFRLIEDYRCSDPDETTELRWCSLYAQSQMIVGVHGSGMLIPTALAAGFIELLPSHKIRHLTEDLLLNHPPRLQLFLGRHLDLFTKPALVSKHLKEIFQGFSYLYQNTKDGEKI